MSQIHRPESPSSGRGRRRERDSVRGRLDQFFDGEPPRDGPGTSDRSEPSESLDPLHCMKRHPEDPQAALKIGVGEGALLDPDAMRVKAVDVGMTMQAVEPARFDRMAEAAYDGLHRVRRGAVESLALQEAGSLAG